MARGPQYYTLSSNGSISAVQALGTDGVGVIVSSVVPFPWSAGIPIVKEYQDAMRAIGIQEFSFVSLEGYISAKVFIEALRRAGKEPTRAKLVAAAESMRPLRLGGFELSYSPQDHSGSHFVDINIISTDGRFRK
jgi:ABC-type branched-subunit amino acid transport system substrate-binding protein